jgi:hypothetical protein
MWETLLNKFWTTGAGWAARAAWGLVAVETATGALLLYGGSARVFSLIVATGLLAGFTMLALVSSRMKARLVCACFGRNGTPLGRRHVWRNSALLAIGMTALLLPSGEGLGAGGISVSISAAAGVTLVAFFYDEIVDLLSGNW